MRVFSYVQSLRTDPIGSVTTRPKRRSTCGHKRTFVRAYSVSNRIQKTKTNAQSIVSIHCMASAYPRSWHETVDDMRSSQQCRHCPPPLHINFLHRGSGDTVALHRTVQYDKIRWVADGSRLSTAGTACVGIGFKRDAREIMCLQELFCPTPRKKRAHPCSVRMTTSPQSQRRSR